MNELVIKVARKGEGKTKWLLNIAHDYRNQDNPIFLYTDSEHEYSRFCEKYFSNFASICKVKQFDIHEISADSIVLIDDVLNKNVNVRQIQEKCKNIYITIEGSTKYEAPLEYEQLSISIL